jgi:ribulose-phosphate 3-epimerase
MGAKAKLSPSILNADFADLRAAIKAVEPVADYIHLDVMDGHFVPNITFGPIVVETVKRITTTPRNGWRPSRRRALTGYRST